MRIFKENKTSYKAVYLTIVVMAITIVIYAVACVNTSKNTQQEKLAIMQNALERAVVNCYAIEGFYPESVEYMENNYGVVIDRNKYTVQYEALGSNVRPYIKVLTKGTTSLYNQDGGRAGEISNGE